MRKVKKTVIIYPFGVAKKLAERYEVSQKAVRNALNYVSQSEQAEAIRQDCLKNYGGKKTDIFV